MQKIWLNSYPAGIPAEINPDRYHSLVELFIEKCKKYQSLPALHNLGCELTYRELAKLSHRFATYLQQKLGLKKGDRLAIMLPNVLQYPVVLFGALQAGLIAVNVNPLYTVPEVVHQVNDSGAETIVVLANFAQVVQTSLPQTRIKHVIVTEMGDLFPWLKSKLVNWIVRMKHMVPVWNMPHAKMLKHALAEGAQGHFVSVPLQGDDIAFLQYTGGTTGVAKGAILTHRNILANVAQVVAWVGPTLKSDGTEIMVTPLPLYHIFSLTANCFAFLCLGALNVLITNPRDIPALVKELSKFKFTAMTGVNTLFNALLNFPKFAALDFSSLKIALGGGASVQQVVAERWQKVTGKPLYEGYGLTETSPVVCITPIDGVGHKGSIGLPVPSTEIAICNEEGADVQIGEVGELCVRGPQVMRGYWQKPEETKKAFLTDGWFKTGDMVRADDKGFVYIVDRKKDMILVSGFNVYPNEIEEVIASHPGVFEVAVVGVSDENSGESVKAYVVKKDPALTAGVLQAYCRERLTGYKRPKHIEFRETLPKSTVGKILRKELREQG